MTKQATPSPLRQLLDERGDGAQMDLARALDVHPTTVWRWANDTKPQRHFRKRIARHLGVKESELWPTT